MPKKIGQLEAASHIRSALVDRGHSIPSRSVKVKGEERWLVFEHGQRSVGIDSASGIWLKASAEAEWHCIEKNCTMSASLSAVEFLIVD